MSAESAVAALLSSLQSLSAFYRSEAKALVQSADDRLAELETPPMEGVTFDVSRPAANLTRVPRPPTVQGIGALTLPAMTALQDVSQITDRFSDTAPTLSFNLTYGSGDLPDSPEFTEQAPTLPAIPAEPAVPDDAMPQRWPDLVEPTQVVVPDVVTIETPDVPVPESIPEFSESVFAYYSENMSTAGEPVNAFLSYLSNLRDDLLPSEQLLLGHFRTALSRIGFWPDEWEQRTYEQAQQAVMVERYAVLEGLDAQAGSQTGLPSGTTVASRLRTELKTLTTLAEAAGKTADARHEQEAKYIQWAMKLATSLADAALNVKAQSISWQAKVILLAAEGAEATIDVASKALGFKRKELELVTRYNKTQIKRLELQKQAEFTKAEALKLEVANNKLVQKYNENQVAVYEAAISFLDNRIKIYTSRIDYLKLDGSYRMLALEIYESEVKAYRAKAKALLSDHAAVNAAIKSDTALAEAEFAKVRLYEAEMSAELANAKAKTATAAAQAAQAKSVLNEYTTTLDAQLQYLRLIEGNVKTAMTALVKGFAAEAAEQELKVSDQEVEDQEALSDALDELRVEQIELTTQLRAHQVTLSQLAAQSKVINGGASTLGGIASAAFQGLNSVAVTELVEEA